ncbi:cytochrome C [Antarcticirhabdus aurantiaca]|uniref:Uncharacterized protein n=1 Tax=Antarcticirhabdus aurantiaca TaxID=2606717 RepID=A0ACD4NKR7_9HYPH|nr:cytochrome C [Antarcticirhabdus aurantiaca]WAJ27362.1 hypothetical protein OXU80_21305 [Jeongeuplla avenae]
MRHARSALAAAVLSAATFAFLAVVPAPAEGVDAPSVEWGRHVAIMAGCHDCHTAGYAESEGRIDPAAALTGSPVGFQGPWGTTYPSNLRLFAAEYDEDQFVDRMRQLRSRPPMPWFNLAAFDERDLRSLHRYILSLGEPGRPAPAYVPPNEDPTSPYVVFAPPIMPASRPAN